jgi:hypothetical protein
MAATKPLGRDILVPKQSVLVTLSPRTKMATFGQRRRVRGGEHRARARSCHPRSLLRPRNAGFVAQAALRLRPRSVARCIAPSFCSDGSPTSLFASMSESQHLQARPMIVKKGTSSTRPQASELFVAAHEVRFCDGFSDACIMTQPPSTDSRRQRSAKARKSREVGQGTLQRRLWGLGASTLTRNEARRLSAGR